MTNYTDFPNINQYEKAPSSIGDVISWAKNVNRERALDCKKWTNLKEVLIRGRLRNDSREAPANSSDVTSSDNENDVMWDASYLYILVNDSGNLEWRRTSLSSF